MAKNNSRQYFRVEGNAAHLVTERIERTVSLDDLLAEANKDIGITTPILPTGCRYFHQQGNRTVFVIEQAPAVRNVTWRDMDNNGNGDKWKLAFPYVVFVVVFHGDAVSTNDCRIYYRTQPLGNGDDRLFRVNLCNTYENGSICTGDMRVNGQTLAQKAESFVANFWRAEFNRDLDSNNYWPAANKFPQVKSLTDWQKNSEKNPLFPLQIKWFKNQGRLIDAVEGRC